MLGATGAAGVTTEGSALTDAVGAGATVSSTSCEEQAATESRKGKTREMAPIGVRGTYREHWREGQFTVFFDSGSFVCWCSSELGVMHL
jgi:hypothetical protein